jgi:hypothetical protein
MEDLVQAQAQDVKDVVVDLRQWPCGEVLNQMVEAALPSKRAGDDIGGKRAIALV